MRRRDFLKTAVVLPVLPKVVEELEDATRFYFQGGVRGGGTTEWTYHLDEEAHTPPVRWIPTQFYVHPSRSEITCHIGGCQCR